MVGQPAAHGACLGCATAAGAAAAAAPEASAAWPAWPAWEGVRLGTTFLGVEAALEAGLPPSFLPLSSSATPPAMARPAAARPSTRPPEDPPLPDDRDGLEVAIFAAGSRCWGCVWGCSSSLLSLMACGCGAMVSLHAAGLPSHPHLGVCCAAAEHARSCRSWGTPPCTLSCPQAASSIGAAQPAASHAQDAMGRRAGLPSLLLLPLVACHIAWARQEPGSKGAGGAPPAAAGAAAAAPGRLVFAERC